MGLKLDEIRRQNNIPTQPTLFKFTELMASGGGWLRYVLECVV